MQARIVSGDALSSQRALLDHREVDIARDERGQFVEFGFAPGGCQIVPDRIPPRKWSFLIYLLAVLGKWRHYQAPAHKRYCASVTKFHPRFFSSPLDQAEARYALPHRD